MADMDKRDKVLIVAGADAGRMIAEGAIARLCASDVGDGLVVVTIPARRETEINLVVRPERAGRDYPRPPAMTSREAKRQNRAMRRK